MSTIHPSPVVLSSVYQRLSHPGKHLKDLKAQPHFLQAHRTKQTHLVTPSFHFNRDPKLLDIQRLYGNRPPTQRTLPTAATRKQETDRLAPWDGAETELRQKHKPSIRRNT